MSFPQGSGRVQPTAASAKAQMEKRALDRFRANQLNQLWSDGHVTADMYYPRGVLARSESRVQRSARQAERLTMRRRAAWRALAMRFALARRHGGGRRVDYRLPQASGSCLDVVGNGSAEKHTRADLGLRRRSEKNRLWKWTARGELMSLSSGTCLVGDGLRELVRHRHSNLCLPKPDGVAHAVSRERAR
jgi:hypothetical protein